MQLQVIGDVVGRNTMFNIYCDELEFSSLDFGKDLFQEVAKYVIKKRASGLRYPIYITDVDLSPNLLGEHFIGRVQVIEYLHYKKRIEAKLNDELGRL